MSVWENLTHSPIFHNFFLGQNGIEAAAAQLGQDFSAIISSQLAQPWFYNVIIMVAAIAIAVTIYAALQAATHLTSSIVKTASLAHTSESIKHALEMEIATRAIVRCVIVIVWFAYMQLMYLALIPFCIVVGKDGILNLVSSAGWLECLFAGVALFIALHVHVILLRLLLMRPRAFGGTYVIMAALE